jgi:hypothetical protein
MHLGDYCIWFFAHISSIPIRAHNGNNEYKKISEQSVPPGVWSCDPVLSSARLHVWRQVVTYSMKHKHPLRADDKSIRLDIV